MLKRVRESKTEEREKGRKIIMTKENGRKEERYRGGEGE